MADSGKTPRPSVSAQIALVSLAATVIGLIDAALVAGGIAGSAGAFQYIPPRLWIVSPVVWALVAAVPSALLIPLVRNWGGVIAAAALPVVFAAIRLRGRPALLSGSVAGVLLLVILARGWLLRWLAKPRRGIAASLILGLSAGASVAAAPSLRAAPAAAPGAAGPNVIVIFLDTVRYDAIFDADGRVHDDLPTLARLRGSSTVFTRAYGTTSWTLPSSLSAVTGVPAGQLGVSFDSQVYRRADPTLAERFRRRGYRTAAVISNSFLNAGSGFARGFDIYEQAGAALDLCRTAPGLMGDTYWPWFSAAVCNWTASDVSGRARALMDDTGGPFFLTLNFMDAHDPYYVERSCGGPDGYRGAVRCIDRYLAPIVDWRSPRRPTVIAVLGDHGEQFGEHGLAHHGNSLFTQVLHVPLMVRDGAVGAARTDATPISIAALPSLVDGTAAAPVRQEPVLAVLYPPAAEHVASLWSALDGDWHLIAREHGPEALYYLPADPEEEHDLIESAPRSAAIDRLHDAIQQMRREPRPDLRKFRSLGYIH